MIPATQTKYHPMLTISCLVDCTASFPSPKRSPRDQHAFLFEWAPNSLSRHLPETPSLANDSIDSTVAPLFTSERVPSRLKFPRCSCGEFPRKPRKVKFSVNSIQEEQVVSRFDDSSPGCNGGTIISPDRAQHRLVDASIRVGKMFNFSVQSNFQNFLAARKFLF